MNRVQKFQTRWKKYEADRHALANAVIEKRDEIPGVQELQNQGGLKEAAAVFTEEGLQIFAQLFANAVEHAIQNHLSQAVESAVEKKMAEVFEIATTKIRMVTEQLGSAVLNSVATAQEVKQHQPEHNGHFEQLDAADKGFLPIEHPSTQTTIEETRKPVVKQKKRHSIKEQSKIVAEYLRNHGRQRVCDLAKNVDGVFWSSNPWIKITQFCKVNPQIRKYKGYYEYVEQPEQISEAMNAMNQFEEMGILN